MGKAIDKVVSDTYAHRSKHCKTPGALWYPREFIEDLRQECAGKSWNTPWDGVGYVGQQDKFKGVLIHEDPQYMKINNTHLMVSQITP